MHYSFSFSGRYEPSKLNADQHWSDSVNKHLHTSATGQEFDSKPRQMLKDASTILSPVDQVKSSYRMPPGTSRTRKFQETYVKGTS